MRVKLYDYWRSSAAYRVRIALALKGVEHEVVRVSLLHDAHHSDEHLARNPQGFVPALEVDGRTLTQSLAIIDWLDFARPEPRLIPTQPDARAAALETALTIGADIHPLNNLRVLRHLKADFGVDEDAQGDWVRRWIREGFEALERRLSDHTGAHLGGDNPGIADIFLVPQIYNARRYALDLAPFPTLVAADEAARAHPAFAAAHPDRARPADA